jgi:hypothetical protein
VGPFRTSRSSTGQIGSVFPSKRPSRITGSCAPAGSGRLTDSLSVLDPGDHCHDDDARDDDARKNTPHDTRDDPWACGGIPGLLSGIAASQSHFVSGLFLLGLPLVLEMSVNV